MITNINPSAIKDGTISASKTDETIATKEELTELSLKVGKLSEITPTLSSGVQIATLKKEVEGQEVETQLYAPNGGGESGTWEDLGEIELTAFRTDIALLKDYRKILVQFTKTVTLSSAANISPSWRRIGGQSAFGHAVINLQSYNFVEILMESDGTFVYARVWANSFEANYSAIIGHTKHLNIAQEKFDAFSITSSHFESLAGQKFHIYGMK